MNGDSVSRCELFIGPAGWSYDDWAGKVYPDRTRIDRLLYIARYFDCIELNSSFYRVPSRRTVESWRKRISTVPRFLFTVKVHRSLTHERNFDRGFATSFIDTFAPLADEGRVGAFLLQFPWSFRNDAGGREYVSRLGSVFGAHPSVLEVRHGSWGTEEAASFIAGSGFSMCCIDQPVIGDSIGPVCRVTDPDLGYIRLHGRNSKDWFRQGAGRDARYDYLYSGAEIEEWKERALSFMAGIKKLFIITNNHYQGQALVNALQIKALLEANRVEVPESLASSYPELRSIMAKRGDTLDLTD